MTEKDYMPENEEEQSPNQGEGRPPQNGGEPGAPSTPSVPQEHEGPGVSPTFSPSRPPMAESEMPESALSEEPEPAAIQLIGEIVGKLPEEVRPQFIERVEKSMNVISVKESTEDDIVGSLKKLPLPPGEASDELVQQMLKDSGHSEKIENVMNRKGEWETTEEELADEPELTEEEKMKLPEAKSEVEEIINGMKDATTAVNNATTPEEVEQAKAFEEDIRGRLGSWSDRNAGLWQKSNRLLVRPGVAILIAVAVIYLMCLNVATRSASARVGGGGGSK